MSQEGRTAASDDDLRSLFLDLWRFKWFIALTTTVGALVFLVIGFLTTPVYRATTILVPTFNERGSLGGAIGAAAGQLGGLASLVGLDVNSQDAATQEAIAVLKSRQFIERFIQDHQLLPLLFPERWDEAKSAWRPGKEPSLAKGSSEFKDRVVHIEEEKKTGLIAFYVDWTDGKVAAAWANEIVSRLNEEMRTRAMTHATASVEFLEKELTATSTVETRQAINHLVESQVKQRMLASVSPEYAFRVVDPALPPDAKDWVRPRRVTLVVIGVLLGFFLSFAGVYVKSAVLSRNR